MRDTYFEYTTPYLSEIREEYDTPYRFSDELREAIQLMFSNPTKNKHHMVFNKLCLPFDTNDMARPLYLIAKHYLDNPQQYGHAMDNVVPHMLVAMWKRFLVLHKNLRGETFTKYMPTDMKMLALAKGGVLDILLSDIKEDNFIWHGDDMVKKRDGIGLREQRLPTQEGSPYFEYLCTLE